MCGITGHIKCKHPVNQEIFTKMINTLAHRGPDGAGIFISENQKIALGHRRLSFLDLSDAGKQPMSNTDQTLWITFNGEIYNFIELREELNSVYHFKTASDTEVLLAAYETWGIDFILSLKGMFAFALLDQAKQKIFLVRDRFGIKPLYYSLLPDQLIFASELKAILASGEVKKEMDFSAFADYFVYRYIPSPKTIWQQIQKLPAAHYAEIDVNTLDIQLHEYWKLESSEAKIEAEKLIQDTDHLLRDSVRQHVRADVPIGSFLSGGYDSSALVHYMKTMDQKPATFSIGFSAWEKSEDQFAKIVADHLEVPNRSVIADSQSLDLLDVMPDVYDEPIADISIVPTYMVSRLARTEVKAVLSGEGADELFGGYTWQHDFFEKTHPKSWLEKLKAKFNPIDPVNFYAHAMAMGWFDRAELQKMLHPDLHRFIPEDVHWFYRKHFQPNWSPLKSIQYMDIKCFMGELVLTKVDRASMANSLEVRVPFLDHQLFEQFFSLKENQYFKRDQTKYVLYKNIEPYLPKTILARKKQGFVGPDAYYMQLDWYKEQLKNSKLVEFKIVNQAYVDALLNEKYNWKLWKILVMEKWFTKWMCS